MSMDERDIKFPTKLVVFLSTLLALAMFASTMLKAQTPSGYQQNPDCQVAFTVSTLNAQSPQINNTQVGCTSWSVQYSATATGPGPVIELTIQSALDNGGAPGVWAPYPGTILTGTNPMIIVGSDQTQMFGYVPWLKVRVTNVLNVTVRGVIYGWKIKPTPTVAVAANVAVTNFPANQAVTMTNTSMAPGFVMPMNLGDTPNIDAFSRLRVSEAETVFESTDEYLLDSLQWNTVTATGGTNAYNTQRSSTSLTTTNANGSRSLAQTRSYFRYQPGKSQLILATGLFGNTVTDNVHRAGLYDDNNGLYLEVANVGGKDQGAVVRRTDVSGVVVDNRVAQPLWNVDPMDGTGPSGITVDWSKTQIFVMDFQWLGVGRVRMALDIAGVIYPIHVFNNANTYTTVYMRTPNLPLRYENLNTAAAGGASTMEVICSTVMAEGGLETSIGTPRSASTAGTTYTINTTRLPVLCIRPALTFQGKTNRAKIVIDSLGTMSSGNTSWSLYYYAVPAGGTFVNVGNSIVETDGASVAGTTRSTTIAAGGIRAMDGFISSAGGVARNSVGLAVQNYLPITLSYNGAVQDYLCLCAQSLTGNVTVSASMNWREIY